MHKPVHRLKGHRGGKYDGPTPLGASSDGPHTSSRLHVTDKTTGWTFLVDTGADVSIILARGITKGTPTTEFLLYAANGSQIKTYGRKLLTLNLGLRRPVKWSFLLANVTRPVMGADLISHYGLLVDLPGKRLIDRVTNLATWRLQENVAGHAYVIEPGG